MIRERLNVKFDADEVAIECDDRDAANRLASVYEHALTEQPTKIVGTVRIGRTEKGYLVRSSGGDDFLSHTPTVLMSHVKGVVHRLFMKARRDLVWLHGSALERDMGVVILSGMAAQGKSTIAGELLRKKGWKLLSDDISPVRPDSLDVVPYFEMPVKRRQHSSVLELEHARGLELEPVSIDKAQIQRNAGPLRMIAFLSFDPTSKMVIHKLQSSNAALQLLENTANFGADAASQGNSRETSVNVFNWATKVASGVRAYRCVYADSFAASQILEELYLSNGAINE